MLDETGELMETAGAVLDIFHGEVVFEVKIFEAEQLVGVSTIVVEFEELLRDVDGRHGLKRIVELIHLGVEQAEL